MRLADPESISMRADKQQRALEISVAFPHVVPKMTLYGIEEEIRQAYELNVMRIRPRYPFAHFDRTQIPDLLRETNRRGIVANGFFANCDYQLAEGRLEIRIPLAESGVGLMYSAETPKLMEEIIYEEFGDRIRVSVGSMDEQARAEYYEAARQRQVELERQAARAEAEYVRMQRVQERSESNAPVEEEKEVLPRAATIYSEVAVPEIEDGICRIGNYTFDISSPEFIFGEPFEIKPTAIAAIDHPLLNFCAVENRTE